VGTIGKSVSGKLSRVSLSSLFLAFLIGGAPAEPERHSSVRAQASLRDDVLTLSTGRVTRIFRWNNGDPIGTALVDEGHGVRWPLQGDRPDLILPGSRARVAGEGQFHVQSVDDDGITPAHLLATIETRVGDLDVRHRCTLFDGAPAIQCTVSLRGQPIAALSIAKSGDNQMIENAKQRRRRAEFETDRLALPGRNWSVDSVRFETATDHHDTLVHSDAAMLYREDMSLDGNLLTLAPSDHSGQIFVLKEAPPGADQVGWPRHDFLVRIGDVGISGSGFQPTDISPSRWTDAYGIVVGVAAPGRFELLNSLREYMETVRPNRPQRDATLTSNTWGDRSRDSRVTEQFMLREINVAASLGLTNVQLDDGWQVGTSRNSAAGGVKHWDAWRSEDWLPNPQRLPHGLAPLVAHARERGVAIGLWFNPSKANDYADWARDADILIGYWRKFGISNFKIDGVDVTTAAARRNLQAFYDRVTQATHGAVIFDVDVTAGQRPGYFSLNRYGAFFLENRYTDWGNYYPYRTLRNLWMLSAYIPPQWLQVEFLNGARNADRYLPDDRFAPGRAPLSYAFATTIAAQPLAWMDCPDLRRGNVRSSLRLLKHIARCSLIYSVAVSFQSARNLTARPGPVFSRSCLTRNPAIS